MVRKWAPRTGEGGVEGVQSVKEEDDKTWLRDLSYRTSYLKGQRPCF